MGKTDKTVAKQLKPFQFKKGESGNPKGRPKGSVSIKDRVRQYLESNPTDMEEFVAHFVKKNRELAWQMLEGRPAQDLTSAGEKIEVTPIYGGKSVHSIQGHEGNTEGISTNEED
jgi:hypothetical protein